MPWKTKLTKLLSIDYPIIQGGMAYISDGLLAAAMAHAGCAGVIGSGGFTTDEVRDNIRRAKDILGPRGIFGVNLMLQPPNKDDVAQIVCDEKVPFVTLGAGNPLPWFDDLHHAGWWWKVWKPAVTTASSPSWPFWKTYFQILKFPSSLPAAL